MTARAELRMNPEDPGPIKDKKVKEELRQKYSAMVDDGIANLQKALDIDKEYDDAMAYMNLLIRERADLLDSPDDYKKQIEIADAWVQKNLSIPRGEGCAYAHHWVASCRMRSLKIGLLAGELHLNWCSRQGLRMANSYSSNLTRLKGGKDPDLVGPFVAIAKPDRGSRADEGVRSTRDFDLRSAALAQSTSWPGRS